MKIYIHAATTSDVECSANPFVEAELDFAPNVGDLFWMGDDIQEELENKIVELYKKRKHRMFDEYLYGRVNEMLSVTSENWRFITPEMFAESLSLDDMLFVVKRHVVCYDGGLLPKGLHIYLADGIE